MQVLNNATHAGKADLEGFNRIFGDDPAYDPAYLQLIWRGDQPVAAAGAWHDTVDGEPWGMIHWVGVDLHHRRQGLGKAVVSAALRVLQDRGFHKAFLGTQAWRLPAIAAYLRLGFEPWPHDPPTKQAAGRDAWDRIMRDMRAWRSD